MERTKAGLLLAGVLFLWLVSCAAAETSWETSNAAGLEAFQKARYAEAEKRWLAALEEAKNFGPDDQRLALSYNNLAELYRVQGNYAQAELLYKRSLAIREKILGLRHPDVAQSLNSLAELYGTQGNHAEAEPLHKRSLAILEKALGPEHPNVALSLENYALLLREMDRDAEAEKNGSPSRGHPY